MSSLPPEIEKAITVSKAKYESLIKWDNRFLALAKYISAWSKDPSTKVGTVIAKEKRFISIGYNGFPQGVEDTEERLNNRDWKYPLTVHGELNALNFADGDLSDCTLYNYPFMPCSVCAGPIIQRGIKRVVSLASDNPRWLESFEKSLVMFREAKVELILLNHIVEVL